MQLAANRQLNANTSRSKPVKQTNNNNNSNIVTWTTNTWTQVEPNTATCFNIFNAAETRSPSSSIGTHYKLVSVEIEVISGMMIAIDRASRLVVTLSAAEISVTVPEDGVSNALTKQGHQLISWPQFTGRKVVLNPRVGDITESNRGELWLFIGNSNADAIPIRGPGPNEPVAAKPNPFQYRLVYRLRQYNNALNL